MHNTNTKTTIVSFFSGYGGLEIGISAALGGNTRVLAYVERDAFPVANLVKKMEQGLVDTAPVFTDITQFPYREFRGLVDIACGGVPCQPHSHAGKRQGGADERFLFDDFCDGMAEMRPGIIFIENVEGLLSSKMPDGTLCIRYVLNRLEKIGYCVEKSTGEPLIGIFSASEVGAPHQRKRVFILAYDSLRGCVRWGQDEMGGGREVADGIEGVGEFGTGEDVAHLVSEGLQGHAGDVHGAGREGAGAGGPVAAGGLLSGGETVGDSAGQRLRGGAENGPGQQPKMLGEGLEGIGTVWPSRPSERQYGWEPPRVVTGNLDDSKRGAVRTDDGAGHIQNDEPERADETRIETGRKTFAALGRVPYGPAAGVDFPGCTGLSDTELAEIYSWMEKGTNRTDELRMCGNGVVPQTAERAFRVLYAELCGRPAEADDVILKPLAHN